jgi:hypothetical protein
MKVSWRLLSLLAFSTPLGAQVVVIDEGAFVLYVNGERVGREQFSIKRSTGADGVSILAKATITLEGRRLETTLRTDTLGQPLEFFIEEFRNGRSEAKVRGAANAGRFVQRAFSATGQSEKEIRLPKGTVVSDSETVHQFYFVGKSSGLARVPVVAPRGLGRDSLTVSVRSENQEVELGNGKVPSRHLIVMDAAGIATDVWVDAQGRLLRVAIPSRGFVAVRDTPPA